MRGGRLALSLAALLVGMCSPLLAAPPGGAAVPMACNAHNHVLPVNRKEMVPETKTDVKPVTGIKGMTTWVAADGKRMYEMNGVTSDDKEATIAFASGIGKTKDRRKQGMFGELTGWKCADIWMRDFSWDLGDPTDNVNEFAIAVYADSAQIPDWAELNNVECLYCAYVKEYCFTFKSAEYIVAEAWQLGPVGGIVAWTFNSNFEAFGILNHLIAYGTLTNTCTCVRSMTFQVKFKVTKVWNAVDCPRGHETVGGLPHDVTVSVNHILPVVFFGDPNGYVQHREAEWNINYMQGIGIE